MPFPRAHQNNCRIPANRIISNSPRRDTPPGVSGLHCPMLRTPGTGVLTHLCRERSSTVPQNAPRRPAHFGEIVHTHIHIVGNGLRAVPIQPGRKTWNGTQVVPYNRKSRTPSCAAKRKAPAFAGAYVGITYFHGPSPSNYRRRK